jgi:hypothetical protein
MLFKTDMPMFSVRLVFPHRGIDEAVFVAWKLLQKTVDVHTVIH